MKVDRKASEEAAVAFLYAFYDSSPAFSRKGNSTAWCCIRYSCIKAFTCASTLCNWQTRGRAWGLWLGCLDRDCYENIRIKWEAGDFFLCCSLLTVWIGAFASPEILACPHSGQWNSGTSWQSFQFESWNPQPTLPGSSTLERCVWLPGALPKVLHLTRSFPRGAGHPSPFIVSLLKHSGDTPGPKCLPE